MAKKAVAAKLCTITFPVLEVPYSLGIVLLQNQNYPERPTYFASDSIKDASLKTSEGVEFVGYNSIFEHILNVCNIELIDEEKEILKQIIDRFYKSKTIIAVNGGEATITSEIKSELADNEEYLKKNYEKIINNNSLLSICSGSPLIYTMYSGEETKDDESYGKKIYNEMFVKTPQLSKPAVGQVGVALKRYERERIGNGPSLKDAVMGKVCTRFPPEPSGYIHIGHAKAALLNHYFARLYKGRLHFRLDDTNPAKEREEFVENMHRDLKTLGVDYDTFSHTSDHFDYFCERAKELIRRGLAYCDQTQSEEMQRQRLNHEESAYRNNSVEENERLFAEMLAGSEEGQKTCLRAKIDMNAVNGCMRDPVMYRVNVTTPHNRTGDKWKAYPTYDFACPIVDSIEGITHALRTTEFLDRNEQYEWFCKTLGLRCPKIQDFSRFNLQYSIMSKRHLQWFVDQGIVENWFDPRFPTVQGLVRRGLQMEALKAFILEQGASRKINYQEWDKIWAVNKQFIEPTARRFHAIHTENKPFTVKITGGNLPVEGEDRDIQVHPKNQELGTKKVHFSREILIDAADAENIIKKNEKENQPLKFTLMSWGNMLIKSIDEEARIIEVEDISDTDKNFSDTIKVTWITKKDKNTKIILKYFGHLITKAILGKEDDFKDYVNKNSLVVQEGIMADNVCNYIEKGDVIQIERWGFYYVDEKKNDQLVLHYVPEGKQNSQSGAFNFEN